MEEEEAPLRVVDASQDGPCAMEAEASVVAYGDADAPAMTEEAAECAATHWAAAWARPGDGSRGSGREMVKISSCQSYKRGGVRLFFFPLSRATSFSSSSSSFSFGDTAVVVVEAPFSPPLTRPLPDAARQRPRTTAVAPFLAHAVTVEASSCDGRGGPPSLPQAVLGMVAADPEGGEPVEKGRAKTRVVRLTA